jgi:hypothetical protein
MTGTVKKPSFTQEFPASSAILAEFRKVFGAGVEPIYCEEADRRVGKALDESRFLVISGADLVLPIKPKEKK